MTELADQGITILMVSSDMEEVIGMSDRIVVMHERRIKGILPRAQATQQRIGRLMTGRDDDASPANVQTDDERFADSEGREAPL
jgi:ribose transport system ATP-binding protein